MCLFIIFVQLLVHVVVDMVKQASVDQRYFYFESYDSFFFFSSFTCWPPFKVMYFVFNRHPH